MSVCHCDIAPLGYHFDLLSQIRDDALALFDDNKRRSVEDNTGSGGGGGRKQTTN